MGSPLLSLCHPLLLIVLTPATLTASKHWPYTGVLLQAATCHAFDCYCRPTPCSVCCWLHACNNRVFHRVSVCPLTYLSNQKPL
jgi:hypothetical protein